MENYIVSARKYRPVTFDTVIGQDSITRTLKNAIRLQHLAHAYLFCGPRGVGKTTCARIFAKTINCSNLTPETEACNECESCRSFNESRSFNIHELDAASNNSVEDIRNLIDQIRIPPQIGKYSIYIIDEVHMLSAAAFNSFLKTLEEPPRHAIFILATTEKHKIIPTILSRCQIFDFSRIKVEHIVSYLAKIAKKEGIQSEPDALTIIAQKADGAMRDSLSIFDQIVSYAGNNLTYKQVIENLNVLDYDYYFRLTDLFLRSDYTKSLLIFNEILEKGFDPQNFISGLAGHFRDLLMCRTESTLSLLEVGAGIREKYRLQASECAPEFLFQALQICTSADLNFRFARNQRLHVELSLLHLSRLAGMPWELPAKYSERQTAATPATAGGEKKNLSPEKGETPTEQPEKTQSRAENQPLIQKTEASGEKPIHRINVPENSKPAPKPPVRIPSSISIKDAMKGQPRGTETKNPVTEQLPEKEESLAAEVTEKEMLAKFNEFVELLRMDKPRMYNALRDQLPVLGENLEIIFRMNNTSQQDVFNTEVRIELLKFMRRELHNSSIQISTFVKPVENEKTLLYSPEDKFEYMQKKNPELQKFRQQMNLDFD